MQLNKFNNNSYYHAIKCFLLQITSYIEIFGKIFTKEQNCGFITSSKTEFIHTS